jgi:hypothetical protein
MSEDFQVLGFFDSLNHSVQMMLSLAATDIAAARRVVYDISGEIAAPCGSAL